MQYFPLFVDTNNLNALVVGAGEVAARKIELLLKTQASITVVAPWACNTVLAMAEQGQIVLHSREYTPEDLAGQQLAFIATNDEALNAEICEQAKAQNILANVVDNQPLCRFITPSIIDRSPIVIAMVSGGVAPVLLRYLRQKLEAILPRRLSRLGQFAERFRDKVKARFDTVNQRRNFWEQIFDGDIAEKVLQGDDASADVMMERQLSEAKAEEQGEVYLIGAGPGDPELLTFRALRLMQKADVVVYDRLVSEDIMELVRRDAEKIYVGKAASNHTLPQQDINQLLVSEAKAGKRVVRLKGGDPFIFGRGGEELQTLIEHHIGFEVVPGVTAASGASCYAGIPLTHRDHAQSVVFATGHLKDDSINLDWPALVQKNQTLVFYMGLTGLPVICRELIAHGMVANTPIAVIEQATTARQQVVTGTLADIESKASHIQPPALIVVGSVVDLHSKLNWFYPERHSRQTIQTL
ncbi:Uroporphyrinogen-III C-methyltransferase [Saliniradius amylolyticus]|uniref:Siroheme synthase n=1 Tax=Saliniradius amylolyticus TaxID=2183582 RepID=A0A2S2E085_9ALTE|nr:siroheme synthase CysG [Saliniradius amylolyticus]AWL11054.1 Uroporphyrinogen-III C-methyltransferase [Saliniradius amylolyticus]